MLVLDINNVYFCCIYWDYYKLLFDSFLGIFCGYFLIDILLDKLLDVLFI